MPRIVVICAGVICGGRLRERARYLMAVWRDYSTGFGSVVSPARNSRRGEEGLRV
jgi:hypothetical protein